MRIIKRIIGFYIIVTSIAAFAGCRSSLDQQPNLAVEFTSFRDIPGITEEEIEAILELQKQRDSFTYVVLESAEAFITMNGEIGGFSALLCEWLSNLFEIPFHVQHVDFDTLVNQLTIGLDEIDFLGDFNATEERRQILYMSDTIALRWLKSMRLRGSQAPSEIVATRPVRYAFLRYNAARDDVEAVLEPGTYESFTMGVTYDFDGVYQRLKDGEADAFIVVNPFEAAFDDYDDIVIEDFMPLIFNMSSIATRKPELAPIISVVNKAIQNGASVYLNDMYNRGYFDYRVDKLQRRLTEEEKEYLQNTSAVPLATEFGLYPVSFFDKNDKQWKGIAFDVLREITNLTGLAFEVVHDQNTDRFTALEMLADGRAHIIPDVIYTEGRKNDFIWPDYKYLTEQYVLVSKPSFPTINPGDIPYQKIGLIKDTAYAEIFRSWFPQTTNAIEYQTMLEAFEGLDRGDVDLVMANDSAFSSIIHYYELFDYKIAFIFGSYDSTFGINKDQTILRSILDKTLPMVNLVQIKGQWESLTYGYQSKLMKMQRPWIISAVFALLLLLILLIIIFMNDIKKRKTIAEKAAAEMASQAKSTFLATMSHEIRTPMNSIMGFAELAVDSDFMPQIKDYLGKITDSTQWLLHIIDDILDLSKIEAGRMELERVPFDLSDIYSRCQSVILPSIKEKGLELILHTEPSTGKKLLGDPVRIYQVIMNLLSNAVKFTHEGYIQFSSSIKNADEDRMTVYFEIKDSGIGMSADQIERIFDQFIQGDSSTTRNYGGTGLGLAIVKNMVELMGGTLSVESTPGVGSIFSFEITFDTIDAPDDMTNQLKVDLLERPHFDGLVLVCDDNSLNQELICAHLARVGLKTIAVENGKLAVDIVSERNVRNEKPFDLILMDIFMPVMDGMEAASHIMKMNPGTHIVAMSANIMYSELEKYKKNGMPDCLGKPFTSQELWHLLLKYLPPVGSDVIDEQDENGELLRRLQINFYKQNQTVVSEISVAVAVGDITLAHRLAHSLNGNAGMIGKIELSRAAAEVEALLRNGTVTVWENKMSILNAELLSVLAELKPIVEEYQEQEKPPFDATQALALFATLEPMLENINPECASLLDEIRSVPGAEKLAEQIANYDFESALITLRALREEWEASR